MAIETKVSGTWRNVKAVSVKVSGTWRNCKQVYVKVAGVWKALLSTIGDNFIVGSSAGGFRSYSRDGTIQFTDTSYDVEDSVDAAKAVEIRRVDYLGNFVIAYCDITNTFFEEGLLRIAKLDKSGAVVSDTDLSGLAPFSSEGSSNSVRNFLFDKSNRLWIEWEGTFYVLSAALNSVVATINRSFNFVSLTAAGTLYGSVSSSLYHYNAAGTEIWAQTSLGRGIIYSICTNHQDRCVAFFDGNVGLYASTNGSELGFVALPSADARFVYDCESDADGNIYGITDQSKILKLNSSFSKVWAAQLPGTANSVYGLSVLDSGEVLTATTSGLYIVSADGATVTEIAADSTYNRGIISEQGRFPCKVGS